MQRVLITGASGLIGRVLRERLAATFDLVPMTRTEALPGGRVGDLSNLEAVLAALDGIDAVVHLAGAVGVEVPWEANLRDNIVATQNVFEAARRRGVGRVVFASSNHVVGNAEIDGGPRLYDLDDPRVVRVEAPVRPDSLYGVSKVFGEATGRFYSERFGLRVVCLRIGSVLAGDDPDAAAAAGGGSWLGLAPSDARQRFRATWLSHRDCAQLFERAVLADVTWAVAFGTSANRRQIWDLTSAREVLGYEPLDGA